MISDSCITCGAHQVIPDPDPHDWFCDDDLAVVCTNVLNPKRDMTSDYMADTSEHRTITVSCRPYNIEKETKIPSWCPGKIPLEKKMED
jgi:hypothetical protein